MLTEQKLKNYVLYGNHMISLQKREREKKLLCLIFDVLRSLPETCLQIIETNWPILSFIPAGKEAVTWHTCPINSNGLKPTFITFKEQLADEEEDYIKRVIAHEFAHIYLQYSGDEDSESEANKLADEWGFFEPRGYEKRMT